MYLEDIEHSLQILKKMMCSQTFGRAGETRERTIQTIPLKFADFQEKKLDWLTLGPGTLLGTGSHKEGTVIGSIAMAVTPGRFVANQAGISVYDFYQHGTSR